jgi:hypothetical protein
VHRPPSAQVTLTVPVHLSRILKPPPLLQTSPYVTLLMNRGRTVFVTNRRDSLVSKVISMPERSGSPAPRLSGVRDRRYTLRYPFAADAEVFDLETGKVAEGVTSDISMGGCFVCTSKPLPVGTRARLRLTRKDQVLEALVVVRIVKPRVGMGIEFFDVEPPHDQLLAGWLETLRRTR